MPVMTTEMVRISASSCGSRYQARIREPNTAMPGASARKYVTNVGCSSSVGTKPPAQSDHVPTMPPTSAATRHEPTRKITTSRGRLNGCQVPASRRSNATAVDASSTAATPMPVLARIARQRHVRLPQERKTVQKLANKDRRQDPWSEDKGCRHCDTRGRINRTDPCRAYAENQHHEPGDAVGHKHRQVKENGTCEIARRVIRRRQRACERFLPPCRSIRHCHDWADLRATGQFKGRLARAAALS